MGMYINSTVGAMAVSRHLYQTSVMQTNIIKKLSSGIKINSASDNAAGLSLTQQLSSVINGNSIAKNNTQTGIAFLNTADGALSGMSKSIERIRNLAVQASNSVYTASERQMMQNEVYQLTADIQKNYNTAKFSDINVFSGVSSGSGSSDTAIIAAGYDQNHIIHNANELISKITGHETENFILAGDIDLSSLGTINHSAITGTFSGNFNGNGYTISNLSIDTGGAAINNIGLFAEVTGTIENLSLQNVYINATDSEFIGSVAGTGGTMTNVSVYGANITAGNNHNCLGGLVGWQNNGTVSYSRVTATSITAGGGSSFTGGLIGYTEEAIYNSYASTTINVGNNAKYVGGFTGDLNNNISECYAAGSITTGINAIDVGGFGAGFDTGTIQNCYSAVNINAGAVSDRIGGFASYLNGGTIINSYATGSVSAPSSTYVGGFVGRTDFGNADNSNFYKNNMSTDNSNAVDANVLPSPASAWDDAAWDKSGATPQLKNLTTSYTQISGGGGTGGSLAVQVGPDSKSYSKIILSCDFDLPSLTFDISNQNAANQAIADADNLLNSINQTRSKVGSDTNKLTSILGILDNRIINTSSSKSTIYDADIAGESALLIKSNIQSQTTTALLSQVQNLNKNLIMALIE